jgi:hypothetical protein
MRSIATQWNACLLAAFNLCRWAICSFDRRVHAASGPRLRLRHTPCGEALPELAIGWPLSGERHQRRGPRRRLSPTLLRKPSVRPLSSCSKNARSRGRHASTSSARVTVMSSPMIIQTAPWLRRSWLHAGDRRRRVLWACLSNLAMSPAAAIRSRPEDLNFVVSMVRGIGAELGAARDADGGDPQRHREGRRGSWPTPRASTIRTRRRTC